MATVDPDGSREGNHHVITGQAQAAALRETNHGGAYLFCHQQAARPSSAAPVISALRWLVRWWNT
jgi:hypothetical protein